MWQRAVYLGLVLILPACTTIRTVSGPPADYLEVNNPSAAWARLDDGQEIVIEGPRVLADTVFGWIEGEEVSIPADRLEEVRVRQLSPVRSALIPTVLVGGAVAAYLAITAGGENTYIDDPDADPDLDPD